MPRGDLVVTRDIIQMMAATFLGADGNRQDPLANPFHADLSRFPPMYIQTGADETLLDDSRKLADLARRAAVDRRSGTDVSNPVPSSSESCKPSVPQRRLTASVISGAEDQWPRP
jgi:acetyl esterase/lipase